MVSGYYNYTDLGIVSAQKPINTHLIIECSDGDLYLIAYDAVDAANQRKLYKSTDKGDNWSLIDTRTYKCQSLYYDSGTEKIWGVDCDNDGSQENFYVWNITLSNDSITEVGNATPGAGCKIKIYDIWKNVNIYVILVDNTNNRVYVYDVDVSPFTEDNSEFSFAGDLSYTVNIGTDSWYYAESGSDTYMIKYTGSTFVSGDFELNYTLPDSRNQCGIAYDGSNTLYCIFKKTADSKTYLIEYNVSGDSITVKNEYNIALMLDRNAASGVMEKGFHLTEYEVYQLHEILSYQLYLIANPKTDAILIAITDNFLINNDGDVFEYELQIDKIVRIEFVHEIMNYPKGTLGVDRDYITIEKGMFFQLIGKYTSAGLSSDEVIFEGIVVDFDGERLQKVWLESPAKKELLNKKPRGDFSGRSDEIMTTLLSTYCKYITKGTFSVGTAMGTVTYAGDKSLMTILIELALFEKWIWYLDPQGRLFFNDGTIDSLVNLSSSDKVWMVKTGEIREPYNYFYIKGAIVSGVQLYKELEEADDLVSQQLYGYNPYEETFASFNSQSILNTLTTNVKARLKETPLVVEHWHYDASLGMIAIGETVTFVYDTTNVNVASDQFLNNRVLYKFKQKAGGYTIANKLI